MIQGYLKSSSLLPDFAYPSFSLTLSYSFSILFRHILKFFYFFSNKICQRIYFHKHFYCFVILNFYLKKFKKVLLLWARYVKERVYWRLEINPDTTIRKLDLWMANLPVNITLHQRHDRHGDFTYVCPQQCSG